MAKKKVASNPKKRKKAAPTQSKTSQIKRGGFGIFILILIVTAAGIATNHYLKPAPEPSLSIAVQKKQPPISKPLHKEALAQKKQTPKPKASVRKPIPHYEIFPEESADTIHTPLPQAQQKEKHPKIAIIIDDVGYDRNMANRFMSLQIPVTLSILPASPHAKAIADKATKHHTEVMLHLPMEPEEYPKIDPGPDALLLRMAPDELLRTLEINLAAVPHVRGVNNHMGSRLTAAEPQMNQVFTILKKRDLFFIDSRTSSKSRCRSAARLLKVPFAERDVFLDHVQSRSQVRKQVERLFRIADRHGAAIGIGHPHKVTIEVLEEVIPAVRKNYNWTHASAMVHTVD